MQSPELSHADQGEAAWSFNALSSPWSQDFLTLSSAWQIHAHPLQIFHPLAGLYRNPHVDRMSLSLSATIFRLFCSWVEPPTSAVFSRMLNITVPVELGRVKPTNSPSPPSARALTA